MSILDRPSGNLSPSLCVNRCVESQHDFCHKKTTREVPVAAHVHQPLELHQEPSCQTLEIIPCVHTHACNFPSPPGRLCRWICQTSCHLHTPTFNHTTHWSTAGFSVYDYTDLALVHHLTVRVASSPISKMSYVRITANVLVRTFCRQVWFYKSRHSCGKRRMHLPDHILCVQL